MAELISRDGTWTFDGTVLRIVPGRDRNVHALRQTLGEVAVPLPAVAGIAYEPGRKGGRLRLRLRDGADPLLHATAGRLPDSADPYQMAVDSGRTGVAEYFADEVRNALLLEEVPTGPCDHFLLPGPKVPLSATGMDGNATFDGERIRITWSWMAEESKKSAGVRELAVGELAGVEWQPAAGLDWGYLRFQPKMAGIVQKPDHDPNCLMLWGFKKESGTTALLAAAVTARLSHPSAVARALAALEAAPAADADAVAVAVAVADVAPAGDDPDALLRRLRELGELHRDGILTDEEFATAKQALLRRLG